MYAEVEFIFQIVVPSVSSPEVPKSANSPGQITTAVNFDPMVNLPTRPGVQSKWNLPEKWIRPLNVKSEPVQYRTRKIKINTLDFLFLIDIEFIDAQSKE